MSFDFSQFLSITIFSGDTSSNSYCAECKNKQFVSGVQIYSEKLKVGLIQIGYRAVGIIDNRYERSILQVSKTGKLIFSGRCFLGSGIRMVVTGHCEIGNNVNVSGNTSIICYEKIKIGDESLISWDCLLMDTDFHKIYDEHHNQLNSNRAIEIGNHVWIGARASILKGSVIPNGSVIGASTVCAKELEEQNCIYAGNPIRRLKSNIFWEK